MYQKEHATIEECDGTASRGRMRGWSVLESVALTGSGVSGWFFLLARWIHSKAFMALFPYMEY